MTTVDEVNRDKTKVPDSLFFVMFHLFVLLLNSMSKLIHNRCTCKYCSNPTATYLYANEQLCLCFYVLIRYSLLFSSEIILKQLFPSGSVNVIHLMYVPEGNS